jgi:hypothetical protein
VRYRLKKDNASTVLLGHGHKDVLSRHLIDSKIPIVIEINPATVWDDPIEWISNPELGNFNGT